jgi:hypothetical protein
MGFNVIDITQYVPKSSDLFLFDNSVWMYLFCPVGNYNINRQRIYSSFLKSVETSKSSIFMNSLILSEFTNRYLRFDFEIWKRKENKYSAEYKKDFIGSQQYKDSINEIIATIKNILYFCNRGSDNFNAVKTDNIFKHLKFIDFNDSYYLELSSISNYKIVTDDHDFINYKNHNQEILTILKR